jgi:hypothetical protein
MRSWHSVFGRRIAGFTLAVAVCELSLTGDAALKFRANLLAGCLLERIGATTHKSKGGEGAKNG